MKIIVKTQSGSTSIIDTEDSANIQEVMDLFVGALWQEGYHIDSIREVIKAKNKELTGE